MQIHFADNPRESSKYWGFPKKFIVCPKKVPGSSQKRPQKTIGTYQEKTKNVLGINQEKNPDGIEKTNTGVGNGTLMKKKSWKREIWITMFMFSPPLFVSLHIRFWTWASKATPRARTRFSAVLCPCTHSIWCCIVPLHALDLVLYCAPGTWTHSI